MAKRARAPRAPLVAVAYRRVSTEDQTLGPEAQRAAIETFAAREGLTVATWHTDQGVGGAVPLEQRPGLMAALASLGQLGAGVLVVARRDRLARDVVLAALIERLCERQGARLLSAAGEGGDGDDPAGQLMRRIVDAFAEYERALIRARTTAALAAKRRRGERAGAVPWGFRADQAGRLEPDAGELAAAQLARDLSASGLSVRAVVAELEARGVLGRAGRPLCRASVRNLLAASAIAESR